MNYTEEELKAKGNSNLVEELKRSRLIKKKYEVELKDSSLVERLAKEIPEAIKSDKNYMFWSKQPGTGKTVTANKLGYAYIVSIISANTLNGIKNDFYGNKYNLVQFVNINELLFLRKDFNVLASQEEVKQLEDRIMNCDIVIWDDIGMELSAYDKEYLTLLIDKRLNQYHKINIYTSNCEGESLFNAVGARLYSRIHENTEVIEFKGGDRR